MRRESCTIVLVLDSMNRGLGMSLFGHRSTLALAIVVLARRPSFLKPSRRPVFAESKSDQFGA